MCKVTPLLKGTFGLYMPLSCAPHIARGRFSVASPRPLPVCQAVGQWDLELHTVAGFHTAVRLRCVHLRRFTLRADLAAGDAH